MKQVIFISLLILTFQQAFGQTDDKGLSDFFGKKEKPQERTMLKSSFSKKHKEQKKAPLSSPFSKKERAQKKEKTPFLPDFYAKAIGELSERSQLPSFFNKAIEKEKERTQQPDFFSKGIFKTKYAEPGDFFSRAGSTKKREFQSDHFSGSIKDKVHSEDDVTSGSVSKKRVGKRFIGERFALFTSDPNKKSKPKTSKKARDPFGKKKRDLDRPQVPRNETDLFQGGVLPKMKDLR